MTSLIRPHLNPDWSPPDHVSVLERLPSAGWPGGLYGRRDALMIVLMMEAGFSASVIERMQRSDAVFVDDAVVFTAGGRTARLARRPSDPRSCPVAIYLRWARLLARYDRTPSSRDLMAALQGSEQVTADTIETYWALPAARHEASLIPAIDRWGQIELARWDGFTRLGMSADQIARVVAAHLTGLAPARAALPAPSPEPEEPEDDEIPEADPLERGVEDRGLAARRRSLAELADLNDEWDEIDATAAAILARTEELLRYIGED